MSLFDLILFDCLKLVFTAAGVLFGVLLIIGMIHTARDIFRGNR